MSCIFIASHLLNLETVTHNKLLTHRHNALDSLTYTLSKENGCYAKLLLMQIEEHI